jgi:hypothetical protein
VAAASFACIGAAYECKAGRSGDSFACPLCSTFSTVMQYGQPEGWPLLFYTVRIAYFLL